MATDEKDARQRMKAKRRNDNWEERKERSKLSREEITLLEMKRSELRRKVEEADGKFEGIKKVDKNDHQSEEEKEDGGKRKADLKTDEDSSDALVFRQFHELPISQRTLLGLERGHYQKMTPIQQDSLHLALVGYDVLGAAKTGSGKTLCFVIPVLEQLFLQHWSPDMGVGAILLTPTRELALQIFKVIQLVGYKHVVSAALLTGGRDVNEEKKRLHAISIIIGTPGRILHHLQDTADLVLDNLQILCMDEADRLLDMGFRDSIMSILKYLPSDRQTLLYSATQTTEIEMLAHMALKNPRYVTSQVISKVPTPSTLCQNFIVVELHRKLDALLVFLKKHPHDKIVIFASTCNQVKYMYLAFSKILKKMRIPSMCLTSKMKQFRREEVFMTFCRCKAAALFCTDVAARGLDFPLVHWVIQYDCPDSAATYIHRVGRTARAGARGAAVLFLTPSETPFLSYLASKHIPMREIAIRPQLLQVSREIFVALVVQGLKYAAQKAFIAYIRSVYFSANKHVFDIKSINMESFARSLGLPAVPDMSDMDFRRSAKNLPWAMINFLQDAADKNKKANLTRKEKHLQASDMFRQLQQEQKYTLKKGKGNEKDGEDRSDQEEDFLVRKDPVRKPLSSSDAGYDEEPSSSKPSDLSLTAEERMAGLSKHKIRKYIENADLRVRDLGLNKHIVFESDEEDEEEEKYDKTKKSGFESSNEEKDEANLGSRRAAGFPGLEVKVQKPVKEVRKKKKVETEFTIRKLPMAILNNKDNTSKREEENKEVSAEEDAGLPQEEEDYLHGLREHLQRQKLTDADRAKQLRRLRKLQKRGKLSKKVTLEDSGVSARVGGPRPPRDSIGEDEEDMDYGGVYLRSSSDDESDSDDSLKELVNLATNHCEHGRGKNKKSAVLDEEVEEEVYHPLDSDDEEMPLKKKKKDHNVSKRG